MNAICQENFQQSVHKILAGTPRSKLTIKPTSQEKQKHTRQIIRNTKQAMQESIDLTATQFVMGNRISWRKYDRMRKENTLVSPTTPQASMLSTSQDSTATTTQASAHTTPSRHHGSKSKVTPDAKNQLVDMVNSGEIAQGSPAVPTEITAFGFSKQSGTITESPTKA